MAVNRVATYRELDNDLLRQAAFQVLVSVVLKGHPPTPSSNNPPTPHPGVRFFLLANAEGLQSTFLYLAVKWPVYAY